MLEAGFRGLFQRLELIAGLESVLKETMSFGLHGRSDALNCFVVDVSAKATGLQFMVSPPKSL